MEAIQFNARIKLIVERFGAKQISEKTNISSSQIHHLKSKGETTGKNIIDIAEATGVNPLWLLNGEGPMMKGDPESPAPTAPEFSDDEIEMINLFRSASLQTKLKAFQILNEG